MDERERRKRQLAKARRLIATVQRARLGKPGDRADPKARLAIRILERSGATGLRGKSDRLIALELDDLRRRIRRNEPGWSLDKALEQVSRDIARDSARRGGHSRTLGMGDPTTDYDEPEPPRGPKKRGAGFVRPGTDYGSRLRSAGRTIRKSRSSKF
jgi:hypothetical protein